MQPTADSAAESAWRSTDQVAWPRRPLSATFTAAARREGEFRPMIRFACWRIALNAGALLLCAVAFVGMAAGTACAQDILTNRTADREKLILDGARKEGRVVLYSAAIVNQAQRPLAEAFMKKYPFVKMTFWRGDTEEIIAKVSAEMRANNLVADLVEGTGIGEIAIETKIAQPYNTAQIEALTVRYRHPTGHWHH